MSAAVVTAAAAATSFAFAMFLISILLLLSTVNAQYTPPTGIQLYETNSSSSSALLGVVGDVPFWPHTSTGLDGLPGPKPAANNVQPSAAAIAKLQKYDHFIIIQNNQETFDALFGAYPGTNNIARALANANSGINLGTSQGFNTQINRPTNFASAYPLTASGNWQFIADSHSSPLNNLAAIPGQPFAAVPQGPFQFNQLYANDTNPLFHTVEQNPPHEYIHTLYKINGGAMNGFGFSTATSGALTMGYWNLTGTFLFQLAQNYTLFDNFFESAFGGPLLNHIYSIGGRSQPYPVCNGCAGAVNGTLPLLANDGSWIYNNYSTFDGGLANPITNYGYVSYPTSYWDGLNYLLSDIHSTYFCSTPTMPPFADTSVQGVTTPANLIDQLIAAGVPYAYYADDLGIEDQDFNAATKPCKTGNDTYLSSNMLPMTHYARFQPYLNYTVGVPNPGWNNTLLDSSIFYQKLAAGTLENVTWFQPDKRGDWGFTDVSPGQSDAYLNTLMTTIFNSPLYKLGRTMVIVTWTEANGVYDHVPPYAGDRFGPGLRVPTIVVSPDHANGGINSQPYEHYSFIKMIQRRFGLLGNGTNPLLGANRDYSTRDLTNSFAEIPQLKLPYTGPAVPATNNQTAPSATATSKLNKYKNIIEIWFSGNSFDYLMGAYPGAMGINDYLANYQATGKQKYSSRGTGTTGCSALSCPLLPLDQTYQCLPYDTDDGSYQNGLGAMQTLATILGNTSYCYPNAPIELTPLVALCAANFSGEGGTAAQPCEWNTDPNHDFFSELFAIDGGLMDGFVDFPGSSGINGLTFGYYNLSRHADTGYDNAKWLYEFTANWTLFDNFYHGAFGSSSMTFLHTNQMSAPLFGNSPDACWNTSNPLYPLYNPNGPYSHIIGKAVLFSNTDCEWTYEPDPLFLHTLIPGGNPTALTAYPPPLTAPHIGTQLNSYGVTWKFYETGLNSQLNGNTSDPGYDRFSAHNAVFLHFADIYNSYNSTSPSYNLSYFNSHIADDSQFFIDLANNTLPQWSQVTTNEEYDWAISDGDIDSGIERLQLYMNAIFASPGWQAGTTLVVITWSDGGGLWDHKPPYAGDRFGPGIRTPTIVVSPDHAFGGINSNPYEHLSLRKMLQTRWSMGNTLNGQSTQLINAARYQAAADFTNTFTDVTHNKPSGNSTAPSSSSSTGNASNGIAAKYTNVIAVLVLSIVLFIITINA